MNPTIPNIDNTRDLYPSDLKTPEQRQIVRTVLGVLRDFNKDSGEEYTLNDMVVDPNKKSEVVTFITESEKWRETYESVESVLRADIENTQTRSEFASQWFKHEQDLRHPFAVMQVFAEIANLEGEKALIAAKHAYRKTAGGSAARQMADKLGSRMTTEVEAAFAAIELTGLEALIKGSQIPKFALKDSIARSMGEKLQGEMTTEVEAAFAAIESTGLDALSDAKNIFCNTLEGSAARDMAEKMWGEMTGEVGIALKTIGINDLAALEVGNQIWKFTPEKSKARIIAEESLSKIIASFFSGLSETAGKYDLEKANEFVNIVPYGATSRKLAVELLGRMTKSVVIAFRQIENNGSFDKEQRLEAGQTIVDLTPKNSNARATAERLLVALEGFESFINIL